MAEDKRLSGPDLKSGVEFARLTENEPFLGHYEGEAVILVRQGDHVLAMAGTCTHYGGPLWLTAWVSVCSCRLWVSDQTPRGNGIALSFERGISRHRMTAPLRPGESLAEAVARAAGITARQLKDLLCARAQTVGA
jgi:hypothetical protein